MILYFELTKGGIPHNIKELPSNLFSKSTEWKSMRYLDESDKWYEWNHYRYVLDVSTTPNKYIVNWNKSANVFKNNIVCGSIIKFIRNKKLEELLNER